MMKSRVVKIQIKWSVPNAINFILLDGDYSRIGHCQDAKEAPRIELSLRIHGHTTFSVLGARKISPANLSLWSSFIAQNWYLSFAASHQMNQTFCLK